LLQTVIKSEINKDVRVLIPCESFFSSGNKNDIFVLHLTLACSGAHDSYFKKAGI
jgi:hypothetical protein